LINTMLSPVYSLLNMKPLAWFTDPNLVLPSFILMSLWGVFGANTVILLAALKGVPRELYESADLDGANGIQKFFYMTIPLITPALFYNLITSIIGALGIFTQSAFIDAPASAGVFWNYNIYVQAFTFRKMGYASALGWFWLVIIAALTLFVFRSSSAWVFYEGRQKGGK
jgi:multiple sugar transport system permease protein